MEFGYFTLSDNRYPDNPRTAEQMIVEIRDQAVYAETIGMHSAWIGEHHFNSLGILSCPEQVLTYIADITVNGHPETKGYPRLPATVRQPKPPANRAEPTMGTRNLLEQKGPQAVADWMKAQRQLLITDTTMRDGPQSLLATPKANEG